MFRNLSLLALTLTFGFTPVLSAHEAGTTSTQDVVNTGVRKTVVGEVIFEKRQTVVPFFICEIPGRCPVPQTYWAMILEEDGVLYEVAEIFGLGKEKTPESIELKGVTVRPGSRLLIDGEVEQIGPHYSLITDVKEASLVMDVYR